MKPQNHAGWVCHRCLELTLFRTSVAHPMSVHATDEGTPLLLLLLLLLLPPLMPLSLLPLLLLSFILLQIPSPILLQAGWFYQLLPAPCSLFVFCFFIMLGSLKKNLSLCLSPRNLRGHCAIFPLSLWDLVMDRYLITLSQYYFCSWKPFCQLLA